MLIHLLPETTMICDGQPHFERKMIIHPSKNQQEISILKTIKSFANNVSTLKYLLRAQIPKKLEMNLYSRSFCCSLLGRPEIE